MCQVAVKKVAVGMLVPSKKKGSAKLLGKNIGGVWGAGELYDLSLIVSKLKGVVKKEMEGDVKMHPWMSYSTERYIKVLNKFERALRVFNNVAAGVNDED